MLLFGHDVIRGRHMANFDNEANKQAEFWMACRDVGLDAVLEFGTPIGRLDVAIFGENRTRLLGIVEVKKYRCDFKDGQSTQIKIYKQLGVKIWGLANGESAVNLAKSIKEQLAGERGVDLAQTLELAGNLKREVKWMRGRPPSGKKPNCPDKVEEYRAAQARIDFFNKTGVLLARKRSGPSAYEIRKRIEYFNQNKEAIVEAAKVELNFKQ